VEVLRTRLLFGQLKFLQ